MKKLALVDFEYSLSDRARQQAADFVSGGCVQQLQEVERHYWVAKVMDTDAVYESEIMITPSRIKAFSCECWSEPRTWMCTHIAATLLTVRKFLDQKAAERQQKKLEKEITQPDNQQISLRSLLPGVPPESLMDFVKSYARKDAAFSWALKTYFADRWVGKGNVYLQLLQPLLPKTGKVLKEAEFRRLQQTIQEMQSRSQSATSEGDNVLIFKIASAVITTLPPLYERIPETRQDWLLERCELALEALAQVYAQASISPELRDDIWDCYRQVLLLNPGLPEMLHRPFIQALVEIAVKEPERYDQITRMYFEQGSTSNALLRHIYLVLLAGKGMTEGVLKVLADAIAGILEEDVAGRIQLLRGAVLALYYAQAYAAAGAIIPLLLAIPGLRHPVKPEMEQLRFSIAEKTGDIAAQIQYLSEIFMRFGHVETLDRIRQIAVKKWPSTLKRLLADLEKNHQHEKIATLLVFADKTDQLLEFLLEQNNLHLLTQFGAPLTDEQLAPLLMHHFISHFEDHFGRPATDYVRQALIDLVRQGRVVLVRGLIKEMVGKFPDRVGLADGLNAVWKRT